MFGRGLRQALAATALVLTNPPAMAAPLPIEGPIEQARLLGALRLDGQLFHVQGLEIEGPRVWVTSVDRARRRGFLHEFDRVTGRLLRRIELTDGPRYHPGGISVSGGSIWIPVSEMKRNSSSVLVEINIDSFGMRRKIAVADHLGCVAASAGSLVAGNWDSQLFYIFDLSGKAAVRTVPNPTANRYQDIKFVAGVLVAGGYLDRASGSVDWIDWPSMKLSRTLRSGTVAPARQFGRGRTYTGEGMAIKGEDLYVVPEDGPSRMFHFRLER
jgi:Family of unknown function (DUF6454)